MKEEILNKITIALASPEKGRNSMGTPEAYYNPYYMVGKCFSTDELEVMSEIELNNIIKLAEFASETFY